MNAGRDIEFLSADILEDHFEFKCNYERKYKFERRIK